MSGAGDYEVGRNRPPKSTRFGKGMSGNPGGRPVGRHRELPHEAVLGPKVKVIMDGVGRMMEMGHAFLHHIAAKGRTGNSDAAREVMDLLEEVGAFDKPQQAAPQPLVLEFVQLGSVDPAMRRLNMATLLYPYVPHARLVIEPWLVEAALARLGAERLTPEQQKTIVAATRTPHKVRWPAWWTELPPPRG